MCVCVGGSQVIGKPNHHHCHKEEGTERGRGQMLLISALGVHDPVAGESRKVTSKVFWFLLLFVFLI